MQIGEALCDIAGKKNKSQEIVLMPVNNIKAIIGICIAFTAFFLYCIVLRKSCLKTRKKMLKN